MRQQDLRQSGSLATGEAVNSWVTQGRDSRRRRDAARERFLREVREMPISVPLVPLVDLAPAAIDCRNRFQDYRNGMARPISLKTDPETVARLVVNYLRHQSTPYEDLVDDAKQFRLHVEVYELLQGRILDAIAQTYPDLASECQRQRRRERS